MSAVRHGRGRPLSIDWECTSSEIIRRLGNCWKKEEGTESDFVISGLSSITGEVPWLYL
jgi:hypothetical protein